MEVSPLLDTLSGFLFDEPATSEPSLEEGQIEITEIVEWEKVVEKIIWELNKSPQLMEKLKSFLNPFFKGDLTFLSCLLTNSTVKKFIGEYATKCKQQIEMGTAGKKNTTKAASIRLQGNSLFVEKEYLLAFKMYSRGLMFAKDEDEETPLLYANRSAVYFYLKQFENAIEDIERALKFGYGQLKPTGKLLIRKGFSLLALGRDAEVKELVDANMPASEDAPDSAQWRQLKNESANVNRQIIKRDITLSQFQDVSKISAALTTKKIFRPHERFPWLNAKIDLRYDAEKGYHLVSKEEMKYGEIVALSKPFVSLDPKRESYERCHFCMVPCFETPKYFSDKSKLAPNPKLSPDCLRMVTPLACTECSNVLYCSEACRSAGWTAYHRFECSQMTILSKMNSKAHLALRMFYMKGYESIEDGSPIRKLIKGCETVEEHLDLMVNQQSYSFVHSNPRSGTSALDESLERSLTVFFLLKLMQISHRLSIPSGLEIDSVYNACLILFRHLYQAEVNESAPYVALELGSTVSPFSVLRVDGMTSMLDNSCEATVDSSSILDKSFSSNVKLLYATGAIPVGTQLTLAYDTEETNHFESLKYRKLQFSLRYTLKCACSRCLRESRDCLDLSEGIYYPIACSLCGELMIRKEGEEGDGSFRCSSTQGCNSKYSARQMKIIYERLEEVTKLKMELSFIPLHSGVDLLQQFYNMGQPKLAQLKTAIESTVHLLYGRSLFLAQLYGCLARGYQAIPMAPISERQSSAASGHFTAATHRIDCTHLSTALLYTDKALDILESMEKGPCVMSKISALLKSLLVLIDMATSYFFLQDDQQLTELRTQMAQAKGRYEALLKMTDFDTMVASSMASATQK